MHENGSTGRNRTQHRRAAFAVSHHSGFLRRNLRLLATPMYRLPGQHFPPALRRYAFVFELVFVSDLLQDTPLRRQSATYNTSGHKSNQSTPSRRSQRTQAIPFQDAEWMRRLDNDIGKTVKDPTSHLDDAEAISKLSDQHAGEVSGSSGRDSSTEWKCYCCLTVSFRWRLHPFRD